MLVIALCVILPVTSINNNISSVGRAINCGAGGRGFDSQGRTNTQGFFFKKPRNKGSAFALQTVRPSRGSDDHVKWQPRLQWDT